MNNPVKDKAYGEWHPIVWEPDYGYHDMERPESVWEANELFGAMYLHEDLWFEYEEILEDILRHSPTALIRGHTYHDQAESMKLNEKNPPSYFGFGRQNPPANEKIKPRLTELDYGLPPDLGFRLVRNK